jgi:hypothetical protein
MAMTRHREERSIEELLQRKSIGQLLLLCVGVVLTLVMRVFRAVEERVQRRCEPIDEDHFEECECLSPRGIFTKKKPRIKLPEETEERWNDQSSRQEDNFFASSSGRVSGQYYAVWRGRIPSIYTNWEDCRAQTVRYRGSVFKSFRSICKAQRYMQV